MGFDAAAYAAAKKYVDETAQGLGAVKGSPCTIKRTDARYIIFYHLVGKNTKCHI